MCAWVTNKGLEPHAMYSNSLFKFDGENLTWTNYIGTTKSWQAKNHTRRWIWATVKNPAILNMYSTDIGWWKLFKSRGKRWDLPKLAIPLFKVMSSHIFLMSTLAIPKYHILFIVHHIYIYINMQQFPASDTPKFTIFHYCTNVW